MKVQDYTKEMVDEESFVDMAYTLLHDKGSTMGLYGIIGEFKSPGNYEYDEIKNRVVQLYTDSNTGRRFLDVGENQWGLHDWCSVDDTRERTAPAIQKSDIPDDDDEEDRNLKLFGDDEMDDDNDIPAQMDDQETLDDSDDNEEDVDGPDIVIGGNDDDDIAEDREEIFEDAEDFSD